MTKLTLLSNKQNPPKWVNDIHSKLNQACVADIIQVKTITDVIQAVQQARQRKQPICVAGGRHAMGGQQFKTGGFLLDMNQFNKVVNFDFAAGTITVEAGMQWPELIRQYHVLQHKTGVVWGISQKQTGADRLSMGGAIAANIHGRGLQMKPFIQDVVSFKLVNAEGDLVVCSRQENNKLFNLVMGGYGLFGVVVEVTIQLAKRQKVQRIVETTTIDQLISQLHEKIKQGYFYGDFQFAIDPQSNGFLQEGIFSCYKPVSIDRPIPKHQTRLSKDQWQQLLQLAHTNKSKAFEQFRDFYLKSSGQLYWSDTHQLSIYLDDYHEKLDQQLNAKCRGSEMITELYVPQAKLAEFMADARQFLRKVEADIIYGTVRLIQQDNESFLSWAKENYACIIFNVHTDHTTLGRAKSRDILCGLIDIAIKYQGSYFSTYHRFASRAQVLACYPQFPNFLREKLKYDPDERFQSNWYQHYRRLFFDRLVDHMETMKSKVCVVKR
ncbi:FAD-binding oxidoreductase [Spartinivicinus poritis]|uniref:FAD-binding oxidoreductase n=1 Tax=Spartinivicinus poritis TaxID=2994640 RepID=A0ABT5UHK3_9GAMM|nr:FAD-binding oxidoreductase [Spartinivicinus sp. A2-2]MDE1465877.1 FAD-binding oxidoreductase [Spartinivicinus sp. A2-2]